MVSLDQCIQLRELTWLIVSGKSRMSWCTLLWCLDSVALVAEAWLCQHALFHSAQKMSSGNSCGCPLSYFASTLLLEGYEHRHKFAAPGILERSLFLPSGIRDGGGCCSS